MINKSTGGRPPISEDGKPKKKKGVYVHPDTIERLEKQYGSLSKALEALDETGKLDASNTNQ